MQAETQTGDTARDFVLERLATELEGLVGAALAAAPLGASEPRPRFYVPRTTR